MDVFEIEQTETVTRKEVATRLRRLAKMLSDDGDLDFERGGMHFNVHVPEKVESRSSSRSRPTSVSSRSSSNGEREVSASR